MMTAKEKVRASSMWVFGVGALVLSFTFLGILLASVLGQGWQGLSMEFLQNFPSRFPAEAGIKSALYGTVWVMGLTAFFSVPVGILSAIYLEEFASNNVFTRFIKINISNLAGVPSIVYGILGLALFVRAFAMGRSILAGALTMSLLILPIIIIAASEAIKAVPYSIREGALAVGGTRWQAVWSHILPESFSGIITGVVLALARAIGESAPLIMIGALSFVAFVPESVSDSFTVLAIQIFNWAGRPKPEFHDIAASGIIVLLVMVLSMNALAIYLRTRLWNSKRAGR